MQFIDILKEKVFQRYPVNIVKDSINGTYKFVHFKGNVNTEDFLNHLEKNILLPIEQKNFEFSFSLASKGFKNSCVQSFVKYKPSIEEFNNVFHSFFKNIHYTQLFSALYIKTDFQGYATKNSIYEPYILYLLKQDFTHQTLKQSEFIQTLTFNFHITDNNYTEFKESFYLFLKNHIPSIKKNIFSNCNENITNDKNNENNLISLKEFEVDLCAATKKFIKPQDIKQFNIFWPHIIIQKDNNENNTSILSDVHNTFLFDLNFAYLSENYPLIDNQILALNGCNFINSFINLNLNGVLESSIIIKKDNFCRFALTFNKDIKQNNIKDLFIDILELQSQYNLFIKHSVEFELKESFENSISLLKKKLEIKLLKNKLPLKNQNLKKNKI